MTAEDLDILLREGEGSMLEYKESVSSSLAREMVAMANSSGGRILIGVRDDGTVVGVNDTNEARARIQDMAHNCDPLVKIAVHPIGGVLVVTVREAESKPVQCREGFYWRQGAVTQKLSRDVTVHPVPRESRDSRQLEQCYLLQGCCQRLISA